MRTMEKNWSYIYIFTQTYVYTRAFTNLCTGKKYTICGGNKLAHVLQKF